VLCVAALQQLSIPGPMLSLCPPAAGSVWPGVHIPPLAGGCPCKCLILCPVLVQVGVSKDGLPPLAMPERFQIIYRDSGLNSPLSIWKPVPPKG
jgi:hypothetical protein